MVRFIKVEIKDYPQVSDVLFPSTLLWKKSSLVFSKSRIRNPVSLVQSISKFSPV